MPSSSQGCLGNFLEGFFTLSLPNTCREMMLCHVQCEVCSVSVYWLPAQKVVPVSMYGTSSMTNHITFLLVSLWTSPLGFSLLEWKLFGAGTLLARAQSRVDTYYKDSICRGFFFLSKDGGKNWRWRCVKCVCLCPLEVFWRKIKPLNQGSLIMHHFCLSSGWFLSIRDGCSELVWPGLGWQWMATWLLVLGISGGSGELSSLGALLPGYTAARFSLGMIVTPAEFRPRDVQALRHAAGNCAFRRTSAIGLCKQNQKLSLVSLAVLQTTEALPDTEQVQIQNRQTLY